MSACASSKVIIAALIDGYRQSDVCLMWPTE